MLPSQFTYLSMTVIACLIFHGILWARNASFLWARRRVILKVMGFGLLWQFISDPIGGYMGAWFFDQTQTLPFWIFGLMPIEDLLGAAVVSSAAACAVLVFGYGPRKWI